MKLGPQDVVLVLGVRGSGKSTWCNKTIAASAERVVVWDPHAEYATREVLHLDKLMEDTAQLDKEALSLSVVPNWRTPQELAEEFEAFADLVPSMEHGTLVIIEECALLRRAQESLVYLATQSRHWGVPIVMVAQRAIGIPRDAREQCSHIVSFRQSSPEDVDALVERCGTEAERVRKLPRFEFWAWDESQAFEEKTSTDGQAESLQCRT